MLLALCLVLPIITGGIPKIGNMLSPMHIPVMLCGFICGWQYGAAVGLIAPILRSVIFGAPVMYPFAVAISLELCTYGLISGILYKAFPKKNIYIYPSLLISMLCGRIVWGIARFAMAGLGSSQFGLSAFASGALFTAFPGIICQLLIIPPIVIAVRKKGGSIYAV